MAKLKKSEKAVEINVLPVMSLMTILIPTLISMVALGKIAIVEINLPERSEVSPTDVEQPPDDNALNLTVAVSKEYLEIWARGGSLPKVYFKEMWTFRCKSDNDTITYDPNGISESNPPRCQDGSFLDGEKYKYSIETINLWAIHKVNDDDPGKVEWSVYSKSDSAYLNTENEFITDLSNIKNGAMVATLAESSTRRLECGRTAVGVEDICIDGKPAIKLRQRSAYDELARSLIAIHNRFIDSPDADNIIVLADDSTAFDKIIGVMDRARDAGFFKISLAKLAGGG